MLQTKFNNSAPSDFATSLANPTPLIQFDPNEFAIEQFLWGVQSDIESIFRCVVDALKKQRGIQCSLARFCFGDYEVDDPADRWAWSIVTVRVNDGRSATFLVTVTEDEGERVLAVEHHHGLLLFGGGISLVSSAAALFDALVESTLQQLNNQEI